MLNRLTVVAYGLAIAWLVIAWIIADRITAQPDSHLFIFSVIGLTPIGLIALVRFVLAGRL